MHFKMNLEKKLFQSNKYGLMDVDQNKFGGPIIIIARVHRKLECATIRVSDSRFRHEVLF
jgi:hypothetical protein